MRLEYYPTMIKYAQTIDNSAMMDTKTKAILYPPRNILSVFGLPSSAKLCVYCHLA